MNILSPAVMPDRKINVLLFLHNPLNNRNPDSTKNKDVSQL
ncbi:MAG: hypothetical protein ACYSR0_11935 [Planctomycetota bacterium]